MEKIADVKILNKNIEDVEDLIIVIDKNYDIVNKKAYLYLEKEKIKIVSIMYNVLYIINENFKLPLIKNIDKLYLIVSFNEDNTFKFSLSEEFNKYLNPDSIKRISDIFNQF